MLVNYQQFIQAIPVANHSVSVSLDRWQPILANNPVVIANLFGNTQTARISRDRLLNFNYPNIQQKIIEVLMWGYNNNQRGIPAQLINHQLRDLSDVLAQPGLGYGQFQAGINAIYGCGSSTSSKLAYFFGMNTVLNGQNTSCLILDRRVIEAISNFPEDFGPFGLINYQQNLGVQYQNYLNAMHNLSLGLGCSPDQLELFLFMAGQNFI
jgi:hypothetical protein